MTATGTRRGWIALLERDPHYPRDSEGAATTTGREWWVRADSIAAVVCERGSRGVDATVYIRGRAVPIQPCEQGDDILCRLGVYIGKCRACYCDMPEADEFGGVCADCQRDIAQAGNGA